MQEKGKSFQSVVSEPGVSRQTIHKARRNEGIAERSLSTLGRMSKALGVTTKELYDEVDDGDDK